MANGLYHVMLYAARKDKSKDWICKDCGEYCEYPNNDPVYMMVHMKLVPYPHLICPSCKSENIVFNRNRDSK